MALTHEQRLALAIEFNKAMVANKTAGRITTEDAIKADSLTAEEVESLVTLYPKWEVGKVYTVGDLIQYENVLYETIQGHSSQSDWTPQYCSSVI